MLARPEIKFSHIIYILAQLGMPNLLVGLFYSSLETFHTFGTPCMPFIPWQEMQITQFAYSWLLIKTSKNKEKIIKNTS